MSERGHSQTPNIFEIGSQKIEKTSVWKISKYSKSEIFEKGILQITLKYDYFFNKRHNFQGCRKPVEKRSELSGTAKSGSGIVHGQLSGTPDRDIAYGQLQRLPENGRARMLHEA